jgi:hypothetical protein
VIVDRRWALLEATVQQHKPYHERGATLMIHIQTSWTPLTVTVRHRP